MRSVNLLKGILGDGVLKSLSLGGGERLETGGGEDAGKVLTDARWER